MKITCTRCGIVDVGHCCTKKPIYKVKSNTNNKRLDKKIYKTEKWQRLRLSILNDCNYICLWSFYVDGNVKTANECHHIYNILQYSDLAFSSENIIPLHSDAHKLIHSIYNKNKKSKCIELLNIIKSRHSQRGFDALDMGIYKDFLKG